MGGETESSKMRVSQAGDPLELADDEMWSKAVSKGTWLLGKMVSPLEDLFESSFQSFSGRADLKKWGYNRLESEKTTHREKTNLATGQMLLNPIRMTDYHEYETTVNEKTYPETNATFDNWCNPIEGVLFAHENFGPAFMADEFDEEDQQSQLPMLKHWSDVAYLQWSEAAETCSKPAGLEYIIRSSIENHATSLIINRVLAAENKPLVTWPGVVYGMDTENGKALLGCPCGSGIGYLLSQHKKGLGHKTVLEVRVYHDYEFLKLVPTLVFYIKDVVLGNAEDAE